MFASSASSGRSRCRPSAPTPSGAPVDTSAVQRRYNGRPHGHFCGASEAPNPGPPSWHPSTRHAKPQFSEADVRRHSATEPGVPSSGHGSPFHDSYCCGSSVRLTPSAWELCTAGDQRAASRRTQGARSSFPGCARAYAALFPLRKHLRASSTAPDLQLARDALLKHSLGSCAVYGPITSPLAKLPQPDFSSRHNPACPATPLPPCSPAATSRRHTSRQLVHSHSRGRARPAPGSQGH